MKKLFKVLVVITLVFGLVACSDNTNKDSGSDDGKVKIGLNYELSGDVADYGNKELKGSNLAIKQANANGGNYVAVEYDNKSDVAESVTIANQLVNDGVVGVVGPATSGASAATYQILNSANVLVVSPSATANGQTLDTKGNVYDYVFRTCFEDSYQGSAMAQYAVDTLSAKNAVIYLDNETDYAKGLTDAFKTQFEKLGGTVVATENYIGGDTDFSSVLTKLANVDFDVLYIPGYYNEAGLIIKQAREMGIDAAILGPDGFDSSEIVNLAGEANLNNVYFTTAYTTVDANEKLTNFINAYKAEYNEDPNMFSALAYDATNLLMQAVEKAGSTDAVAVKDAMTQIQFDGVTGAFSFDATHTPVKPVLVVDLINGVQTNAVEVTPK